MVGQRHERFDCARTQRLQCGVEGAHVWQGRRCSQDLPSATGSGNSGSKRACHSYAWQYRTPHSVPASIRFHSQAQWLQCRHKRAHRADSRVDDRHVHQGTMAAIRHRGGCYARSRSKSLDFLAGAGNIASGIIQTLPVGHSISAVRRMSPAGGSQPQEQMNRSQCSNWRPRSAGLGHERHNAAVDFESASHQKRTHAMQQSPEDSHRR